MKKKSFITLTDQFCGAGGSSIGAVVLSGYPSELYDHLYRDWRKVLRSATAQNGKGRVECLWLSPKVKTTLF